MFAIGLAAGTTAELAVAGALAAGKVWGFGGTIVTMALLVDVLAFAGVGIWPVPTIVGLGLATIFRPEPPTSAGAFAGLAVIFIWPGTLEDAAPVLFCDTVILIIGNLRELS
jgi:hypothetical protein